MVGDGHAYTRATMSDSLTFDRLKLRAELLSGLHSISYTIMTKVQAETLPEILAGRDVLARAKTGSGKTAAFGLGLLNRLIVSDFSTQALVLCPTRELADQVAKEIRRLAREIGNVKVLTLCGGAPFGPQSTSLQRSPHVVVGTPGRVLKHLEKRNLQLAWLKTVVLDEADRLLDMGFTEQLDAILSHVPAKRQCLLFSATYPTSIKAISRRCQKDALIVDVTEEEKPAEISQYWCPVTRDNRISQLCNALTEFGGELNIVFCNTKIDCAEVARQLHAQGIAALALHGDLEQRERTQVLVRFANRSATVLVATDVAARGLDVNEVDAVFNFELPKQAEVYVHRIGRTARAGRQGIAVSLIEEREQWRLQGIAELQPDALLSERAIDSDTSKPADSLRPAMTTLQINGGKKNKLRAGDILGALTAAGGIEGDKVGSIDLFDTFAFVAVSSAVAKTALQQLAGRPIKGRKFRVRKA